MTAVLICNSRDLQHPEAGGREHNVETVVRILAADGGRLGFYQQAKADLLAKENAGIARLRRLAVPQPALWPRLPSDSEWSLPCCPI